MPYSPDSVVHEAAQYRCPTCGLSDPDAYIGCNHAMCPDGRDQRRLDPPHWRDPPRPAAEHRGGNSPWTLIAVAVITALLLAGAFWLGKVT